MPRSKLNSPLEGRRIATSNFLWLLLVIAVLSHSTAFFGQETADAAKGKLRPRAMDRQEILQSAQDFIISPGDLLEINVFDVPDISREYRVSPTGFITLPLISEPVYATGKTPGQIAEMIAREFQKYGLISNPQVTVAVKQTRLHSVIIGGAVRTPQIYPVFGPTKLLDVLTQAGGLAEDAGNFAVINRGEMALRQARASSEPGSASPRAVRVDLRRLLESGDESVNLVLYPGDRVTVQRAGVIYAIGAVGRPGGYTLKDPQEEITVLKILALAGDVTPSARRKKLIVMRGNSQAAGGREEMTLNLNDILARRAPDPELHANDMLFVPESGGKKAIRQAVGTTIGVAAGVTTGLIIYRR